MLEVKYGVDHLGYFIKGWTEAAIRGCSSK